MSVCLSVPSPCNYFRAFSLALRSHDKIPASNWSSCMENSQNPTLMFCCSPVPKIRFEKQQKLSDRFVPQFFVHFMTFFPRLETNDALQCSYDSFPHLVIYILCVENCQNYIVTHSCLPIAGRQFYNVIMIIMIV